MFQKHIHKAKFYPSADYFTQALLVMLVTNIMSASTSVLRKLFSPFFTFGLPSFFSPRNSSKRKILPTVSIQVKQVQMN